MAFSAGFHPHPKISYAGGAPTGAASEAEYVEISVVRQLDPATTRAALNEALPDGLDILEVVVAGPGSLAERLEASQWELRLPGASAASVGAALTEFLAQDVAEVTRTIKSGPRTFDVRGAVLSARIDDPGSATTVDGDVCAILTLVVRHTTPVVRPDDILTALQRVTGFVPPRPHRATRLAQGRLTDDNTRVADPLAADKDAAGS